MSEKINELDTQLRNYAKSNKNIDETLFNMGVELGRLLASGKVDAYRLPFFSELETEKSEREMKYRLENKGGDLILKLLKLAYIEQLDELGTIDFSDYRQYESDSELSEKISKKYFLQHVNSHQHSIGGDLDVDFKVLGKLKTVFVKNNISPNVSFRLNNESGEDTITLYDEDSINSSFVARGNIFSYQPENTSQQLETFVNDLEKFLMFKLIKDS